MIGSVQKMKNVFRDLDTKEIVKMIIERCRELGVQIESESIDPTEYKKFLSNAAQLRATYAARLAEEEARKAEEIRRKAAEARKKFLEERDGK